MSWLRDELSIQAECVQQTVNLDCCQHRTQTAMRSSNLDHRDARYPSINSSCTGSGMIPAA